MGAHAFPFPLSLRRSLAGKATKTCLCLVFMLGAPSLCRGQLLPREWQKAVTLIEVEVKVDGQSQFLSAGTGFLVGVRATEGKDGLYLVTAKHVLAKILERGAFFSFRVDMRDGKFDRVPVRLALTRKTQDTFLLGVSKGEQEQQWVVHREFDLAAVDISKLRVPKEADYRVFDAGLLATKERYDSLGLAETDATFVIVYDAELNRRLVRAGVISAMLEVGSFLMEARNLPGDSGSPVVLQPTISRKPGIIQATKPLIIGLVSNIYSRLVPIGKFGNTKKDLLFPQSMNLSLVQPSYQILELFGQLE